MNITFVTSCRSDFGLIRPIIKYCYSNTPNDILLLCIGPSVFLDDDYLREGIGPFPINRIEPTDFKRSSNEHHNMVCELSCFCKSISNYFLSCRPIDWFFVPGDRYEIFSSVIAAYYNNIAIVHIFGGDRTIGGHQDDNVRHAITKMSHVHLAVCEDSYRRLLNLGEEKWRVMNVGSPVVESVNEILENGHFNLQQFISPSKYNILCTYHSITTESVFAGMQFDSILAAFEILRKKIDISYIITYPNNDAGSKLIIERIEPLRNLDGYFIFESLGWKDYLRLLSMCDLVVGNSSSGLLEAPILGVPNLNVGTRQKGRFSPEGVYHCEHYNTSMIVDYMERLLKKVGAQKTHPSHPYGNGKTSSLISEYLTQLYETKSKKEILQKAIVY